jgi:hypothetical protein
LKHIEEIRYEIGQVMWEQYGVALRDFIAALASDVAPPISAPPARRLADTPNVLVPRGRLTVRMMPTKAASPPRACPRISRRDGHRGFSVLDAEFRR